MGQTKIRQISENHCELLLTNSTRTKSSIYVYRFCTEIPITDHLKLIKKSHLAKNIPVILRSTLLITLQGHKLGSWKWGQALQSFARVAHNCN